MPIPRSRTTQVQMWLPKDLHYALKVEAAKAKQSMQDLVRTALYAYLEALQGDRPPVPDTPQAVVEPTPKAGRRGAATQRPVPEAEEVLPVAPAPRTIEAPGDVADEAEEVLEADVLALPQWPYRV